MRNIQLKTPSQNNNENSEEALNPGSLERLLKEIQSDDMFETVRKLDEIITAFNALKTPAANRLKLLEVYHKAFHTNLQGYDEMRIAQLKVSEKQKLKLSNDIVELYVKLSLGYKIIIKDYVESDAQSKQPGYLFSATFRAIEVTVFSLIYAYRFKLDTPPLSYLELNQLYAFAEYYALLDKPIKSVSGYAKTPTITSFYTLALIFVSIEPRQYDSYLLEVLFLALQPFAFKCQISRTFTPSEHSFIYKIDLGKNLPPIVIVDNEISDVSEWTRYLDIGNFVAEINVWLADNEGNKNAMFIEHELELFPKVITRLKVSQNETKLRLVECNAESSENNPIQIVVGLAALESLLIMDSVKLNLNLNYSVSDWVLQSETSTGCHLVSNINIIDEVLSLGELVAIVSGGNEDDSISLVKIAQICGLQQLEQGMLTLELEYLTDSAKPLIYIVGPEDVEGINPTRSIGICLTNADNCGDGSIMVVNRRHYNESQQYFVETREKLSTVEATKLVQQSLKYTYFYYKILHEESNNLLDTTNIVNLAVS